MARPVHRPHWPSSLAWIHLELPAINGKPRLGAPVTGISKFVAIGLNYIDHARETGNPVPAEPVFFLKANSALSGPSDAVEKPRGSTKLDWEVEIAAIIGTRAKYVSEADALNHVAGYCVCNDVSERHFQIERLGQWTKGKSHDTFGPVGPGSSPRTRSPTSRSYRCGSTSTASAARPDRPRT